MAGPKTGEQEGGDAGRFGQVYSMNNMHNTITMIDKKLTRVSSKQVSVNNITNNTWVVDGYNSSWVLPGLGTFCRAMCLGDGHHATGRWVKLAIPTISGDETSQVR